MARAMKCDICGKFYDYYSGFNGISHIERLKDNGFQNTVVLDCCPKCKESIKLYIKKLSESVDE